jgi:hypothetical protein
MALGIHLVVMAHELQLTKLISHCMKSYKHNICSGEKSNLAYQVPCQSQDSRSDRLCHHWILVERHQIPAMTHCDSKMSAPGLQLTSCPWSISRHPRSTKSSEAEWNYHANSRQSCATAPPLPAAPAAAEEPLQQEAARSGSRRPALREW